MFFTEPLQSNLHNEWNELVKDSVFEAEWNTLISKNNLSDICIGIRLFINIVGSKSISDELTDKIICQFRKYITPLYSVSDLYNLTNNYITKINYILERNNLVSQKNQITYLCGEQNLQPASSDTYIRHYNYATRSFLKNHQSKKEVLLITFLAAGLFVSNNIDYNWIIELMGQVALMMCMSKANTCTSADAISAFEMRESHQSIVNQLKHISSKIDRINIEILYLENTLSSSTTPKCS